MLLTASFLWYGWYGWGGPVIKKGAHFKVKYGQLLGAENGSLVAWVLPCSQPGQNGFLVLAGLGQALLLEVDRVGGGVASTRYAKHERSTGFYPTPEEVVGSVSCVGFPSCAAARPLVEFGLLGRFGASTMGAGPFPAKPHKVVCRAVVQEAPLLFAGFVLG